MVENFVHVIGRMVKETELRYTPSGTAYCFFTLAINYPQSRESREAGNEQKVDFIDISAWKETAEIDCKFGAKGKTVSVVGRLGTREIERDSVKFKQTTVTANGFNLLDRAPSNRPYDGQDDMDDDDDPNYR